MNSTCRISFYCIFSIIFITIKSIQTNYQFEVFVSKIGWSGTVDEIYFRLCNINDICGMFTTVPAGWPDKGQTYYYTYTTNIDIGDIHKVQIVHPGSDTLCISHIKINGIQYDDNSTNKYNGAHCIEDSIGGGCDTITIILPDNNWNSELTIPCKYKQHLDNAYEPTISPIIRNIITLTDSPSLVHIPTTTTDVLTDNPTFEPSSNPTVSNLGLMDSDGNNGLSIYKLIFGVILVPVMVVIILLIILWIYCWRRKKKMKEGMHDVKSESEA
eukprot:502575_1